MGERVSDIPTMAGIGEVAGKECGGRAQAVTCVQNLLVGVRIFQHPMIAQSIYHGVSRLDTRGRKLGLKSLEADASRESQRLSQHDSDGGLEVVTIAIQGFRVLESFGGTIPEGVIALELEAEAHPVAAQTLVIVASQDSGVSLNQLVAIAEQPKSESVRAGRGHTFDYAGPALGRVIQEFRYVHFETDTAADDLEADFDLIGLVPAQNAIGDRSSVDLFTNALG